MRASRREGNEFALTVSDAHLTGGAPREPTPNWYERAMAEPETIVWLPGDGVTAPARGITAALAVRDQTGRLFGVVTVDFALSGIADFLRSIKIGQHGSVVLFGNHGEPLAGAAGPGREAAAKVVSRWIRGAGRAPADPKVGREDALIDGGKWDVVVRSIAREAGPPWIVAAALPDSDFMGAVHANRRVAITIMLMGTVLSVAAGIGLSTAMARSLSGATSALDRIARFELDSPPRRRSRLREVAQLDDAVTRLTASLRSFSRYAPEEIVRDVVASGEEAVLSGQEREVTVLFTDLRGFTALTQRLPAEELVAILNDHLDLLVGIVAKHGGFVVDFLGDAVFAVFGAPQADPDHARRAVACAIEMQRARARRNEDNRDRGWPPMEMGTGISTGPAIIGNMGSLRRIKYGVAGSIVNAAARIETLTVGGQVLVADSTRRALPDQLVVDGPFEAEGKGIDGVMRFWDVLALRGERMLVLPAPASDLTALPRPIEARVRPIVGKQIDPQSYVARLHRLSAAGAELESAAPLTVFGALRLLLPATAQDEAESVDAKVTAFAEHAGARTALVRFTAVDWSVAARIEARARALVDAAPAVA